MQAVLCHTSLPEACLLSFLSSRRTGVDLTSYADLAVRLVNTAAPGRPRRRARERRSYRTWYRIGRTCAGRVTGE